MSEKSATQSHASMIVGSDAEIEVTAYDEGRGVCVTITDGTQQLSLSFFDPKPLVMLTGILMKSAAAKDFAFVKAVAVPF